MNQQQSSPCVSVTAPSTTVASRGGPRWRAVLAGLVLGLVACGLGLAGVASAAEPAGAEVVVTATDLAKMAGFIAAALSTGLAALGAAYAVSHVGAAALGAMGERPELSGRALIFLGLAEGIAIYGLIIAIMILGRLG